MAVHVVRDCKRLRRRIEMRHDLVAEQVEVDPMIGRAPLGAAKHAAVKGSRRRQVMDRKS
jgi:hypothetical protein